MKLRRLRLAVIIAVLLPISLFFGLSPIKPVRALPVNSRTIGLFIDASGWHYSPFDTNPLVSVYENTSVTMFLQSQDSNTHQLVISTPTPISSPVMPACCPTGSVVLLTFTASPLGTFSYCDAATSACGTFQVKQRGDVNGDGVVDLSDINTIVSNAGAALPAGWNPGDKPYPDGRVDSTDLLVVSYFQGSVSWPAQYNPDVNGDGVVDILDFSTVAFYAGASSAAPFNNPNQGPDVNYDNVVNSSDIPPSADIDGDGIPDLVELSPEMQAFGADPCRKTVPVEIDYMVAGDHTHRPLPDAISMVVAAFDAAPVAVVNPCPYATFPRRSSGIQLIVDIDQAITEQEPLNFSQGSPDTFETIKATHFSLDRVPYWHYSLWVHDLAIGSSVSGIADFHGNDLIVSLGSWTGGTGTAIEQAGTFMHELGHNLGLDHGGGDSVNFKANYLSVMNYAFQTVGVKAADGTTRLKYSVSKLATLDETNLNEAAGIGTDDYTSWSCTGREAELAGIGNSGLDWNCNGPIDLSLVTADINGDRVCLKPGPNGILDSAVMGDDVIVGSRIHDGPNRTCDSVALGDDKLVRPLGNVEPNLLEGFDDWNAIDYVFRDNPANYPGNTTVETGHTTVETGKAIPEPELTFEQAQTIEQFWADFSNTKLTQSFSPPLKIDLNGNSKVDVILTNGIVTSTSPGQVTELITVTNTAGSSLDSLRLAEVLPVDWRLSPFDQPVRVYFKSSGSLRIELTTGVTVSVSSSRPQTVNLSIQDISGTEAGKKLEPGESIQVYIKMDYALKGTVQPAANYPISYSSMTTATLYSGASYQGTGIENNRSIFFIAYARVLGGGGSGGRST